MVRIITDSAADFEPQQLQEMGIACIPLTVTIGQREYQENVNLTKAQFYEEMAAAEGLPRTAQASPQILIDLFTQAAQAGEEALYICLSSALSGTYQSALMAKNLVGSETNHVLDSRNATGGQRLLVQLAVQLRDEGKTAAQIVESIRSVRDKVVLYACMDTLENLYRGGRISQTAYTLGSMAQIKPLLTVDTVGRVTVPAKAMGMRKGMEQLCKLAAKREWDARFPFYVMYTSRREAARELADKLAAALGCQFPEERIIQVGAAIGTHIGHNAVGFVYIAK